MREDLVEEKMWALYLFCASDDTSPDLPLITEINKGLRELLTESEREEALAMLARRMGWSE